MVLTVATTRSTYQTTYRKPLSQRLRRSYRRRRKRSRSRRRSTRLSNCLCCLGSSRFNTHLKKRQIALSGEHPTTLLSGPSPPSRRRSHMAPSLARRGGKGEVVRHRRDLAREATSLSEVL